MEAEAEAELHPGGAGRRRGGVPAGDKAAQRRQKRGKQRVETDQSRS